MTDTTAPAVTSARARTTVTLLREELAGLGLPEDIVKQVIPTADVEGRPLIRMGASWDVASADRLLAALSGRGVAVEVTP